MILCSFSLNLFLCEFYIVQWYDDSLFWPRKLIFMRFAVYLRIYFFKSIGFQLIFFFFSKKYLIKINWKLLRGHNSENDYQACCVKQNITIKSEVSHNDKDSQVTAFIYKVAQNYRCFGSHPSNEYVCIIVKYYEWPIQWSQTYVDRNWSKGDWFFFFA